MHTLPRILIAVALTISTTTVLAAPISITSSLYRALVDDPAVNGIDTGYETTTTFGTRSVSATEGTSIANSSSIWTDTGNGAIFDYTSNLSRTGDFRTWVQTLNNMSFTASEDATYSLSGLFTADDATSAGSTYFGAYIRDVTTAPAFLFQDASGSVNTIDESFVLGTLGDGDSQNTNIGSLTGNLIAGHNYVFYWQMNLQAQPSADDGATATGNIKLTIEAISVPEPAPLALLGLGIALLGLRLKS